LCYFCDRLSSLGHVLIPALAGGCRAQNLNVATSGSPYLTLIVGLKFMVCRSAGVGGLGRECLLGGVPVTEDQPGLGQVADRSRGAPAIRA
jgi:hypothetical protein